MNANARLTDEELNALRKFDSCMVANAVESFNVRLRNAGFTATVSARALIIRAPPLVSLAHGGTRPQRTSRSSRSSSCSRTV